jgi:hypothetical protein
MGEIGAYVFDKGIIWWSVRLEVSEDGIGGFYG